MKTSFWDKVLMFLYVLIALAFSVCMALRGFGVDLLGAMFAGLEQGAGRFLSVVIGLGLAAIVVLLSAYMLMMLFGKGKKRVPTSFVPVESEDGSQVHMSLTAISQMARQAIGRVPDVKDMKICVQSEGEAVSLSVELILKASAHVPTVTKNMQKSIRDAIEKNCGVTVRDVQIVVSALSGPDAKPEWKKPNWKAGRRGKKESVEAIAAQEAAEPVPEVPESAGEGVDDASAQPYPGRTLDPQEYEEYLSKDGEDGADAAQTDAAENDWSGGFAPLEEDGAQSEDEDAASLDDEEADEAAREEAFAPLTDAPSDTEAEDDEEKHLY